MKKNKLVVYLFFLLTCFSLISNEKIAYCHYGEETLSNLHFDGYATLDGTTVRNRTKINGFLHTQFAFLDSLDVTGSARLQDSTIYKKTQIDGKLLAIHVYFNDDIIFRGSELDLSQGRAQNIYINAPEFDEVVVKLGDNIEIKGCINFQSKNGIVKKSNEAVIRGGVVGGKVIREL